MSNPAIDGGSDLFATGHDARGLGRVDVPNAFHNGANVSDLGAFELQGPFEPASFVVTTLSDVLDLSDGLTSLREALALANSDPDGNTITFAENLSGGTLRLAHGELVITSNVTVDGDIGHDGTADITISADSASGADDATSRVFSVEDHAGTAISAGLRGLVIRDGFADNGGAIVLGFGDQLTLTNTTVSDNTASRSGGGIWTHSNSQLWLDRSTVSDNHAARDGGGIYLRNSAAIGVFNSTVANNSAGDAGGGIYGFSYDAMTLVNATVTGNSAGGDGGGLYNWKGFTSITNSIIAGNAAGGLGDDFFDVSPNDWVFAGGNIIGSEPVGSTPAGTPAVRIDGTSRAALETVFAEVALVDPDGAGGNPAFYAGELDDNGGPVDTVAIRTNGLAHDAGGNAALPLDAQDLDHDGVTDEPLPFDARDLARVINRVVDIGAFEIQNSEPTVIFNHGLAVAEGASGTIGQAALFFIDAEETDITYTVTALPLSGILFLDGTPLAVNDAFTQSDINHGRLSYTHDGGETHTDSFAFEVSDGVGGTVMGQTFDFTINPVNDDPIQGANTGLTLDEGDSATVLGGQLDFDDAEQGDSDITYTVTAATANGTLFLGGTPLGLNGTFTQDDINASHITYAHDGSETTTDSFAFSVSDGAGGTAGGTFDIAVNALNDDPIQGANTGLTLDEGDSATILGTQLDFDDAEQGNTDVTYTVTAATANGTLFVSGTPLGVGGTFTQDDINTNRVTYTHDGSETTADSFGFAVSDGVGGMVAGQTFQISVSGVNDAPGGNLAGGTIQYTEDQARTALDPSLTVTDPDDTHLEGARVAVTGNFAVGQDVLGFTPQAGITGSYDAATGVLALSGHALLADYEAALRSVTYANTSQNPSDAQRTVSFQVDDGGGLVSLGDVGVTVVPVLDPPNDINGDHTSDLVLRGDDGSVRVLEMDGVTVLRDTTIATIPNYWHIIDADSDFDGDGASDILWRDDAGAVVLWTMEGPNILSNTTLSEPIASYWSVTDTGDFTGDGRADILWRDDAGRVVLWEMNGATMVSNRLVADVPTTSHIEDTADFTGDGRNDILWRDDDGTLRIWEMNGASVVSDTSLGTVADTLHLAGTGDFNRDGRFDLLWRDDDGTVRLWELDGANILSDTVLGTLPAYWEIADLGDYNGDLASDILWRDTAGTVVLWEMDGSTIIHNTTVNMIDPRWHIEA